MSQELPNEAKDDIDKNSEEMLKETAITFTTEGLSKDLKTYMQKKVALASHVFRHLTYTAQSYAKSGNKELIKSLLDKNSAISIMLRETFNEIQLINMGLNLIIERTMETEQQLISEDDADDGNQEDIAPEI